MKLKALPNLRYKKSLIVAVALILFGFVSGMIQDTAFADTMPTGIRRSAGGEDFYYTVASSSYTRADATNLAVYYDNRPNERQKITLIKPKVPAGGNPADYTTCRKNSGDFRINIGFGEVIDKNRKTTRKATNNYFRSKNGSAARAINMNPCDAYGNYWIDPSQMYFDENVGLWRLNVTVYVNNPSANRGHFRFLVSADGIVRSLGKKQISYETIRNRTNPTWANYALKFGSDCDIDTAQTRTVTLFDPDNAPYPGGNGHGDAQRLRQFRVEVWGAHRSSNSLSMIMSRTASSVNNANDNYTFTMRPDFKYEMRVYNIDHNNTIQITLPTDEIFHDVSCAWWRNAGTSRAAVNLGSNQVSKWGSYNGGYNNAKNNVYSANSEVRFAHRVENLTYYRTFTHHVYAQRYWTTNPANAPPPGKVTTNSPGNWGNNLLSSNGKLDPIKFNGPGGFRIYHSGSGGFGGSPMYRVTEQDMLNRQGSYLCERVAVKPTHANPSEWEFSAPPACVKIQPSYGLEPAISLSQDSLEVGETSLSGVKPSVYNGGPNNSDPFIHFLSRFIVKKGQSIPANMKNGGEIKIPGKPGAPNSLMDNWHCYVADLMGEGCENLSGQSVNTYRALAARQTRQGPSLTTFKGTDDTIPGDLNLGDQVCYVIGVNRYKKSQSGAASPHDFKYAAPVCATVGKRPKVQFWGGDVKTTGENSDIITSWGEKDGQVYGSWGEYGMFSRSKIDSSSGAGLADGSSLIGNNRREFNKLTFSNDVSNDYSDFGYFGLIPSSPSISGFYSGQSATTVSGDFSNSRVIKNPNGTVRITGDVKAATSGPVSDASKIPQMIIIAKNIIIDPNVKRVDAWLVASDTVSTCGTYGGGAGWLRYGVGGSPSIDDCGKEQLVINGPVQASRLYLRRTHGAEGGELSRPAEVLNLRPDAYMWAYHQASQSDAIQTMYLRELSPRY